MLCSHCTQWLISFFRCFCSLLVLPFGIVAIHPYIHIHSAFCSHNEWMKCI